MLIENGHQEHYSHNWIGTIIAILCFRYGLLHVWRNGVGNSYTLTLLTT